MNGNMVSCTKMSGTPITSISSKMLIACTARVEFIRASLYHTVSASSWERTHPVFTTKTRRTQKIHHVLARMKLRVFCGDFFLLRPGGSMFIRVPRPTAEYLNRALVSSPLEVTRSLIPPGVTFGFASAGTSSGPPAAPPGCQAPCGLAKADNRKPRSRGSVRRPFADGAAPGQASPGRAARGPVPPELPQNQDSVSGQFQKTRALCRAAPTCDEFPPARKPHSHWWDRAEAPARIPSMRPPGNWFAANATEALGPGGNGYPGGPGPARAPPGILRLQGHGVPDFRELPPRPDASKPNLVPPVKASLLPGRQSSRTTGRCDRGPPDLPDRAGSVPGPPQPPCCRAAIQCKPFAAEGPPNALTQNPPTAGTPSPNRAAPHQSGRAPRET